MATRTFTTRTTVLKRLLDTLGIVQAHLARSLGLSRGTMADLVNHGKWPARGRAGLREKFDALLTAAGASRAQIRRALDPPSKKQNARRATARRPAAAHPCATTTTTTTTHQKKETDMLLQKQALHPETRRHFALPADPFVNDVTDASDVFLSADIRYVRETLWHHAKHGGLLAMVGESGSGKSTLVADFKSRLQREGRDVVVIEPSVLYMEENDSKGKTLKSASIVHAIVATVAPSIAPKRDPEARARQVQQLLTAGHRAGQRHVLIIEEAHCLPTATLKHLKRFAELRDGMSPLLSIVLVGQPELRQRLAINNAEVREVAQRCELIELPPMDNALGEYLKFKLARVGCDLERVITSDGIDALRERLSMTRRQANGRGQAMATTISLVYPLAIANAVTAAMNRATQLGAPAIDASIIQEV